MTTDNLNKLFSLQTINADYPGDENEQKDFQKVILIEDQDEILPDAFMID